MLTFVCDQCGATGSSARPGAARCTACGYVAFVEAPAEWHPPPDPPGADPFADVPAREAVSSHDTCGESVAVTERFATLWIRPGAHDTPTPHPSPLPTAQRGRAFRRTAIASAVLAGGAALAWAAAVGMGARWPARDGVGVAAAPPAPAAAPPAPAAAPYAAGPAPQLPPARPETAEASRPAAPRRAVAAAAPQVAASRTALVNPAPQDRRCVPRALRTRRDLADRLPAEIAVRLRVAATGEVGRIEVVDVPDRDVADAIGDAVRSCQFSPGTDEEGRPISLPIVMRIRFASREGTAGF